MSEAIDEISRLFPDVLSSKTNVCLALYCLKFVELCLSVLGSSGQDMETSQQHYLEDTEMEIDQVDLQDLLDLGAKIQRDFGSVHDPLIQSILDVMEVNLGNIFICVLQRRFIESCKTSLWLTFSSSSFYSCE